MAGSCGSCRLCTRPVLIKALSKMFLIDAYYWAARILFLRRRCPVCHHLLGSHKSNLGSYRVEQHPTQVRVSVPQHVNDQRYPAQPPYWGQTRSF